MRWLSFAILTIVVLVVQISLAPALTLWGARPDWLLVLVVFYALHGRKPDCILAAWIIGLCGDLHTLERMGLMSLSYGLAAVMIVAVRESLFKDRIGTQIATTLVTAFVTQLAWCLYRQWMYAPSVGFLADMLPTVLLASLYTACWAPLLHGLMLRSPQLWGLARPRYAYTGMERIGGRRV